MPDPSRPPSANPVIFYHPDGYVVQRDRLMGRHSAGESFLSAFLSEAAEPEAYALCVGPDAPQQFMQAVAAAGRPLTARPITRLNHDVLRRQGLLHLPHPELANEALIRSFLGDDSYALTGITHTIASQTVLENVARFATAPVQPWDALICTSKSVHRALSRVLDHAEADLKARLGATRFTRPMMPIVPLGVHAERFAPQTKDRAAWRQRLGLGDDAIAILFFGRLSVHAKASPFQLAQAAEAAAQRCKKPVAILWCGWYGNEGQRVVFMETAKAMAPSVAFHELDGRDPAVRFSIWAAADIFCSLSDNIQESFGLTIIEAMAAGLPVIASNWDGYREAVESGVDGVLIDSYLPEGSRREVGYRYVSGVDSYDVYIGTMSQYCFLDVAQTAHWIATLASDPALRRKLGTAAQEKVKRSFGWKSVLARYREVWAEQAERLRHARADKARAPSSLWMTLDPGSVFEGFPSNRLEQDRLIEAGPLFASWTELPAKRGVVVNPGLLLHRTEFEAVRAHLERDPMTVADLLARFPPDAQDRVQVSLHWLIKIGLLRLRPVDGGATA